MCTEDNKYEDGSIQMSFVTKESGNPVIFTSFGTPQDTMIYDHVNHPPHYNYGAIEVIDYIEDKDFNFNLGNAIKYISRAGHKNDEIEDLEKAAFYINREIKRLKKKAGAK